MRGWRIFAKWIAAAAAAAAVASWAVGLEPVGEDGRTLFLEEEAGRALGAGAGAAERRSEPTTGLPVALDLPRVDIPLGAVLSGPEPGSLPVQTPGCAYRAPVTSSLARLTRDADSYYQSGLAELQAENLADAQFYFEQALRRQADPAKAGDSAFWIAEILRRQGKNGEALVYYRKVAGSYAQEALFRLARLAAAEGRREEARAAWERIAADPSHSRRAEALTWLGGDLIRAGDSKGARARLDEALEVSGGKGEAAATALLLRGFLHRGEGALSEAEDDLTRYLLHWPDHSGAPAAAVALGWVFLEGGKFVEADRRFRWVLGRGPARDLALRAGYGRVRAAALREDPVQLDEAITDLEARKPGQPWQGWAEADRGWVLLRKGKTEPALESFRKALSQWEGGDPGAVQALVGECLFRLGRLKEAADALEGVERESRAAPSALHRAGEAAFSSGDAGRAVRILGELDERYPSHARRGSARLLRGEALLRLGKVGEAARAFESVPEGDAAHAEALYLRGGIAFDGERWEEASTLYSEFLGRYASDRRATEAAFRLARAHFRRGAPQAALASLESLEKRGPPVAVRARAERGSFLLEMGRDVEGWGLIEPLLSGKPEGEWVGPARLALAGSYFKAGRDVDVLRHLDALGGEIPSGGEAKASLLRAETLLRMGRLEEARETFRRLGEDPEGLYGVSRVLARQGKVDELASAARLLAQAAPGDPRGAEALLLAGDGFSEAGRHGEAASAYALAAASAGKGERSGEALLRRAKSLALASRISEAEAAYGELAQGEGSVVLGALRGWAEMVESAGRPEEAASLRLRAGRRDPDGAAGAVDFLRAGRMYSEMGRWEAAHAAAAEGIARLPQGNDGTRRQLLCEAGAALIEMGRAAEAVPMLREAAAIGGGEAAATRAMALLARALEADGHPEQSLETYLRIGYLYPLTEEAPARAWLEAGRLLEGLGRWSEVRTVYTRVASEAPVAQAEEASRRLLLLEARP